MWDEPEVRYFTCTPNPKRHPHHTVERTHSRTRAHTVEEPANEGLRAQARNGTNNRRPDVGFQDATLVLHRLILSRHALFILSGTTLVFFPFLFFFSLFLLVRFSFGRPLSHNFPNLCRRVLRLLRELTGFAGFGKPSAESDYETT